MGSLYGLQPVAAVAAVIGILILMSVESMSKADPDDDDTYDWDTDYKQTIAGGEEKEICFAKGAASCIEYVTRSTAPILAFVATRNNSQKVLFTAQTVDFVSGSECTGMSCKKKVDVSDDASYCMVMVNRGNTAPFFVSPDPKSVDVMFRVSVCSTTVWRIVGAVIISVLLIAIFACCIACCIHFVRKRKHQQHRIQMAPVAHGAIIPASGVGAQVRVNGPVHNAHPQVQAVGVGTPVEGRPIMFMEAKL